MSSIPELIGQWRDKQINGLALMRGLATYDKWEVRISEHAVAQALASNDLPTIVISTREGKRGLLAFSSNEAYAVFAKANSITETQHFLTVAGCTLFSGPLTDVDEICIDPYSPDDIFYEKPLIPRLKEMATAVLVEDALTGLRHGNAQDGAVQVVREYKNYYLPSVVFEGKPKFLMAPDNNGRTLAAAFTADDTFDAFLPEAEAGGAKVTQLQIDGVALYDTFQRMQIDGFVFNCAGPVKPVAFAQAAAKVFLEG